VNAPPGICCGWRSRRQTTWDGYSQVEREWSTPFVFLARRTFDPGRMVSFDAYWTGWTVICLLLKERGSSHTPPLITISTATTASEHNLLGIKVHSLIVAHPSFSTITGILQHTNGHPQSSSRTVHSPSLILTLGDKASRSSIAKVSDVEVLATFCLTGIRACWEYGRYKVDYPLESRPSAYFLFSKNVTSSIPYFSAFTILAF
jgi:hypothetical protein